MRIAEHYLHAGMDRPAEHYLLTALTILHCATLTDCTDAVCTLFSTCAWTEQHCAYVMECLLDDW